jgi:membrane dipeptidase
VKPIIDAHLDLAINALGLNRDITRTLEEVNRTEAGMTDHKCRGGATVTLPEMHRAGVAVCSATVLGRHRPDVVPPEGFARHDIDYATPEIAHAAGLAQIAYYDVLEHQGLLRYLKTAQDLERHMQAWQAAPEATPLGIILSMEGSDPILSPDWVSFWWQRGLRFASLVHYGTGRYAAGTETEGGITEDGLALLRAFEDIGMALDLTHLADQAFFEALDAFGGAVLASHNNSRAVVPGQRQFSDTQISRIVERGGVIGVACDAWMLYPGWIKGSTKPEVVSMESLADHIDHICQVAGTSSHAAIGSDLDGLYGTEQTPYDLKRISDLQRLDAILSKRGYTEEDVVRVFSGNWLRFFASALPQGPGDASQQTTGA